MARDRSRSRSRSPSRRHETNQFHNSHRSSRYHNDSSNYRKSRTSEYSSRRHAKDDEHHNLMADRGRRDSHHRYSPDDERRSSKKARKDDTFSDEELLDLKKIGVKPITNDDYPLKIDEYRRWLKDQRGKYLDELNDEDAQKYFRRFVRRWNDGALKEKFYKASNSHTPSSKHTEISHQSSSKSRLQDHILRSDRSSPEHGPSLPGLSRSPPKNPNSKSDSEDEIGPLPPASTYSPPPRPSTSSFIHPSRLAQVPSSSSFSSTSSSRFKPTTSDLQLQREEAYDQRRFQRKTELKEQYIRADEAVPRSSGKEGKMEEKRAINKDNKVMRDKEVGGLEVDEGTLLGDSGGFQAALRARDSARARREEAKQAQMEDRRVADHDRLVERKQKENDTMAMLKALAKQRFG